MLCGWNPPSDVYRQLRHFSKSGLTFCPDFCCGIKGVYAILEKPFSSKCGDDGGAVVIALDHPLLKIMTTELITAFHAGYQAGFYIDGCIYSRSKVQAIGIRK